MFHHYYSNLLDSKTGKNKQSIKNNSDKFKSFPFPLVFRNLSYLVGLLYIVCCCFVELADLVLGVRKGDCEDTLNYGALNESLYLITDVLVYLFLLSSFLYHFLDLTTWVKPIWALHGRVIQTVPNIIENFPFCINQKERGNSFKNFNPLQFQCVSCAICELFTFLSIKFIEKW